MTTPNPGNAPFSRGNTRASKLRASQVQEIRTLYAAGHTQGALARDYGVSIVQIGRIVRFEVWQHLPPPGPSDAEIRESEQRMLAEQERLAAEAPRQANEVLDALADDEFINRELAKKKGFL